MKKLILWAAVLGMSISSTIAQMPAKPAASPAKPQMEKAAPKQAAVKSTTSPSAAAPMKADGTPDKRFKKNMHVKKDGSPDKRFSEHKDPKTKKAPTK